MARHSESRRCALAWLQGVAIAVALGSVPTLAQPFDAWAIYGIGGASGYSTVPSELDLNPIGAITLEAWINAEADTTDECPTIAGKDYLENYWIGLCSDRIRSYVGGVARTSAATLADPGMVHVAMTSNGTTRRHYVNGVLTDVFAETGDLTPNTDPLRFGQDVSWNVASNGPGKQFRGIIDEVRLWNVVRTEEELDRYKTLAIDIPFPGLVAVWNFGPNSVLGDHDGTIVGSVAGLTVPAGACTRSSRQGCLRGRFLVEVQWESSSESGIGILVPEGSSDSGMFSFFQEQNWELLVKVLDGCDINDRFWVFASATTDVGYVLRVEDQLTGATALYQNPIGVASPAITDTAALNACHFP